MSLILNQGPLPNDNTVVDPFTFLENWINNTTVAGLPSGAFSGGTLQFVYSQTNPPALAERFLGMFWFARGEGRLYKWDAPDLPSGLTYSTRDWVPLSDRRVVWARAVTNVPLGAPVAFASPSAASNMDILTYSASANNSEDALPRPIWALSTFSGGSGQSNASSNFISETNFIAYETALSGTLFRAVELGFVTALEASGESGNQGALCWDDTRPYGYRRIDPTAGSNCAFMPIAEACDSSATNPGTPWLRVVYKHAAPMIGTAATV